MISENIIMPEGILLGHENDEFTGVTVMLCPSGAVGGVSVRGCAPGTRETDLLRSEKAIEIVNAVALCGGSAYGLDACSGIMRYLSEKNCGVEMNGITVPLVAGAVIFDLNSGLKFPSADEGYRACLNAKSDSLHFGNVGAGRGATVGKIRGPLFADKGGVGAATLTLGELVVTAITCVNAVGDVYDHETGKIVAGARAQDGSFLDTRRCVIEGNFTRLATGTNTTIGCILTNAKLSKLQANKLADIAHDGLAQSIKPVHTDHDGDTLFTMAKGEQIVDFTMLSVMAVEAVSRSIKAAVTQK